MAKKKPALTADDLESIKDSERGMKSFLEAFESSKQFKTGDFLVARKREWDNNGNEKWPRETNSYGAPIKYQVVHTTELGLAFLKKLNSQGNLEDDLIPAVRDWYFEDDHRWELDPEFADSLILQAEYDPAEVHKNRKVAWKEVTDYNKANKICTGEIAPIVDFFKTLKVGDTIWTSNVSHFTIQDSRQMPRVDAKKLDTGLSNRVKGPHVTVLTVVDKKSAIKDITADYFFEKALYKARPRSYKELNI